MRDYQRPGETRKPGKLKDFAKGKTVEGDRVKVAGAPAAKRMDRPARKSGGRVDAKKGGTTVNIVMPPGGAAGAAPPPILPVRPPMAGPPMPPPGAGGPPPMMPPGGAPPMMPPGAPPHLKRGGGVVHAGAGTGLARLHGQHRGQKG